MPFLRRPAGPRLLGLPRSEFQALEEEVATTSKVTLRTWVPVEAAAIPRRHSRTLCRQRVAVACPQGCLPDVLEGRRTPEAWGACHSRGR